MFSKSIATVQYNRLSTWERVGMYLQKSTISSSLCLIHFDLLILSANHCLPVGERGKETRGREGERGRGRGVFTYLSAHLYVWA